MRVSGWLFLIFGMFLGLVGVISPVGFIPAVLMVGFGILILAIRPAKPSPPIEEARKKCPRCAGMVKFEATICRFCSYEFPKEEVPTLPGPVGEDT